jgi:hypothetical protein
MLSSAGRDAGNCRTYGVLVGPKARQSELGDQQLQRKDLPSSKTLRDLHIPTTLIYKASVVKIYNATNSLARFLSKDSFSPIQKRSSLLPRLHCS